MSVQCFYFGAEWEGNDVTFAFVHSKLANFAAHLIFLIDKNHKIRLRVNYRFVRSVRPPDCYFRPPILALFCLLAFNYGLQTPKHALVLSFECYSIYVPEF